MDVHALGTPLGPGERGFASAQCSSILPEVSGYQTRVVIWRKLLYLPLQHTYLEVVGSNPVTGKKSFSLYLQTFLSFGSVILFLQAPFG